MHMRHVRRPRRIATVDINPKQVELSKDNRIVTVKSLRIDQFPVKTIGAVSKVITLQGETIISARAQIAGVTYTMEIYLRKVVSTLYLTESFYQQPVPLTL